MSVRVVRTLAWVNCAIVFALAVAFSGLTVWSMSKGMSEASGGADLVAGAIVVVLALLGAMIVSKRPENLLGLGFSLLSLTSVTLGASEAYANYGITVAPGALPEAATAAWFSHWLWVPAIMPLLTLLFLLCPDGRPPTPTWNKVLIFVTANLLVLTVSGALTPGPLDTFMEVENPYGLSVLGPTMKILADISIVLLLPCIALCGTAMIQRFRRSRGIERLQLKWFAASAAGALGLFIAAWIIGLTQQSDAVWDYAIILAMALVAFATAIAILRYRLYDIDRIINRTLTYAALTAALGGTYFGLVVGLQTLLRPVSGGSDLAIVATTLVVAALFLPARRRVQDAVDRRFNRRAYDAARTIDAFSARLREQIDLDTLRYELLAVVDEAMQPESAGVWLRKP